MKQQKFYMHNKAKDIFIQPTFITSLPNGSLKLAVRIWNLGFTGNPWVVSITNINIKKNEISNWKEINPIEDWKAIRNNQRMLNELQ